MVFGALQHRSKIKLKSMSAFVSNNSICKKVFVVPLLNKKSFLNIQIAKQKVNNKDY